MPISTDTARRSLTLGGALAQVGATAYLVASGNADFSQQGTGGEPPIIPAGYAFAIWGPIYAGSLAYAVYQAFPARREEPLLRRIGWWTALAFWCTAGWLLVSRRPEGLWGTVALLVTITGALGVAMRELMRERLARGAPFSRAEQWLVVAPLSVYLGWGSVAVFANAAAALRGAGITAPGAVEGAIALAMLLVATGLAAWATRASRGNAWYAGTVTWALVAIGVANAIGEARPRNLPIAVTALTAALVVLATLSRARSRA